ncbi:MAG: amino acid ABC transporter substrate-binding protein [Saprospirales bacterium]|nr:MAG: amino acid ABC transporter substrate-binding protein [Saprospirales bacterium]
MHKIYWVAVLALIFAVYACNGERTVSEADEERLVIKALYVSSQGFAESTDDGEPTGFTVELIRDFHRFVEAKHELSIDLIFEEETDWRTFYNRIKDGQGNKIGMGNVTITEERKKELNFSPPYMNNVAALISHADAPALENIEDIAQVFEGRKALAFEGTLHEQRLRQLVENYMPEADIMMAHTNDEIMERISATDEYFAYIDLYNFQRGIMRGLAMQHHPIADESEEQFGYILPLESKWLDDINEWFHTDGGLVNSERYKSLMKMHLGEQLAEVLLSSGE